MFLYILSVTSLPGEKKFRSCKLWLYCHVEKVERPFYCVTTKMTSGWGIHPLTVLTLLFALCVQSFQGLEVIYAINTGGEAHTDSYGIRYLKDPLMSKVGTASDYGKQLIIGRVNAVDQILYQTERYHHSTFGYDIPISEDGDYVMILKFCEVYFNSPNMKVIFRNISNRE